jgi:hypothetical protein
MLSVAKLAISARYVAYEGISSLGHDNEVGAQQRPIADMVTEPAPPPAQANVLRVLRDGWQRADMQAVVQTVTHGPTEDDDLVDDGLVQAFTAAMGLGHDLDTVADVRRAQPDKTGPLSVPAAAAFTPDAWAPGPDGNPALCMRGEARMMTTVRAATVKKFPALGGAASLSHTYCTFDDGQQ